jgi:hypothetical protein
MEHDPLWLIIGFAGQALFSMRFLVQWLQSEKVRRSVIPVAFWYFTADRLRRAPRRSGFHRRAELGACDLPAKPVVDPTGFGNGWIAAWKSKRSRRLISSSAP